MNTLEKDIADLLAFEQKPINKKPINKMTKAEIHKLTKWKEYQKSKRDLLTAMKKKGK